MPGYYGCHIGHAAVAQFYFVLVAYFVQTVIGRKVLSEQAQKFFADVGFHILAKRWVKPHDVSFSDFPRFTVGVVFILHFTRMLATSHCFHIIRNCFEKFITIAREKRQRFGKHRWKLLLDGWRMIRLLVYVEWLVIRLAVRPIFPRLQIKRDVKKSVWTRLVSTEMFKRTCWKSFMIFFVNRFESGSETFSKMAKPLSLYRPTLLLPTSGAIKLSINRPTNSYLGCVLQAHGDMEK